MERFHPLVLGLGLVTAPGAAGGSHGRSVPGDVVFSLGSLLMGWDFLRKLLKPMPALSGAPALEPAE